MQTRTRFRWSIIRSVRTKPNLNAEILSANFELSLKPIEYQLLGSRLIEQQVASPRIHKVPFLEIMKNMAFETFYVCAWNGIKAERYLQIWENVEEASN